jgi:hypothetical protein
VDLIALRVQIDRILHSRSFANKSQLRKLLEILFNNIDSQSALKPDLVIQELWPAETRTKRAADVATEMNRLRHALETYYHEEGTSDEILITLPNRSVATRDGTQEKRWIAAGPRNGAERHVALDHPPGQPSRKNPRTAVKISGALAVLGILTYVSIRVLTSPEQPQSGRLDGSTLVIMNGEGKELWKKTFPQGIGPDSFYSQGLANRIWFGDLEGKGHTSVLFVYAPAKPASHSSTLYCYSDRGKEKWSFTPGRQLPELENDPSTFKTFAFGVLKPTEKRGSRIVVSSAHDIWWPNQIAILDTNGKMLSEYWHSGRLDHMVLADLDGDGKEEIVATGTNNGYLQATLLVLDPDRVFGASAEIRPQFQIHGMGDAQERFRLLFPRSDLNKALFSYNSAFEPMVDHGSIRLAVLECIIPPGCPVTYEFDKNLRLISAYPAEEFRTSHARFFQNGKDAHRFSAEEQTAFQKVRCLAGCKTEFVPVGAIN